MTVMSAHLHVATDEAGERPCQAATSVVLEKPCSESGLLPFQASICGCGRSREEPPRGV